MSRSEEIITVLNEFMPSSISKTIKEVDWSSKEDATKAIKKMISDGYDKELILKTLKQSGKSEEEINKIFNDAGVKVILRTKLLPKK